MSNLRQAAQQALEVLQRSLPFHETVERLEAHNKAITALRAALAEDALQRLTDVQQEMEAQQEPICPDCKAALLYECVACSRNNYPPQRNTEQEPVAWANPNDLQNFDMKVRTNGGPLHTVPLYTSPPQRKPLTINEVEQILAQHNYAIHGDRARYIVRMTEEAHGIGEKK